ncbi:helix-turn-helix domain-containing protein [Streptomyces niveus]
MPQGDIRAIHSLTTRERQVLRLVCVASGNRDISKQLGISERTVKSHLTSVMSKIGVTCRAQASVFGFAYYHLL